MKTLCQRRAFTLIELLVVISIISLVSTIVFSAVNSARAKARDARRMAEIHQIQKGLELYISKNGTLPFVWQYGRSNVSPGWWDGWWDLSTNTGSPGFLNFLVTDGIFSKVPTDPLNTPSGHNGSPMTGNSYFFFNVPAGYNYQGGSCDLNKNTYLIGITDLETDPAGAPYVSGSGCQCLWKNVPNMFQSSFDYVLCAQY